MNAHSGSGSLAARYSYVTRHSAWFVRGPAMANPPFFDRVEYPPSRSNGEVLRKSPSESPGQASLGGRLPGPSSAFPLLLLALRGDLLGVYERLASYGDLSYMRFLRHQV